MKQKGNWTQQEDTFLSRCCQKQIKKSWVNICYLINQAFPDKQRTAKQCREHFINTIGLSNHQKTSCSKEWTMEELDKMFQLFEEHGPHWNHFSTILIGRSQNNIKNKFQASLRKFIRKLNSVRKMSLKYKKMIKYQSVMRVIDASQYFNTLKTQLKQQSLKLRKKVLSLTKNCGQKDNKLQMLEIIQQINQFNLNSRSYRLQKSKCSNLPEEKQFSLAPSQQNSQKIDQPFPLNLGLKDSQKLVSPLQKSINMGTLSLQPNGSDMAESLMMNRQPYFQQCIQQEQDHHSIVLAQGIKMQSQKILKNYTLQNQCQCSCQCQCLYQWQCQQPLSLYNIDQKIWE